MSTSTQYIITPFTLVNPDQLVDVTVAAKPLDDLRKDEIVIGFVDEVKFNRAGIFAHFTGEGLNCAKWIPVRNILGYAHLPTPATTLADELPNVAIDVLAEEVAVETPVAAAQSDGRERGVISYFNREKGFGYVDSQGASYRFDVRSVYGGITVLSALKRGVAVTFTIRDAIGARLSAVGIVVTGNVASEAQYDRYLTLKANKATTPMPRPRRTSINERVERKAAADTATLTTMLNRSLGQ